MKALLSYGFAFFLLTFVACQNHAQTKTNLSVDEFEKGIGRENIQLLDVRTQDEYNGGHLKNAFLADWNNKKVFQDRVQYLDKDKPVYTYCLVGGRSAAAAEWLKAQGFKEVYSMDGGILAWKKNNKAVEGVQTVRQITWDEFNSSIPSNETVLVDIGAPWCPPCKKMEPVVEDLQQSHAGVFKLVSINGSEQENLAKRLGAESFPTFIVYKNKKEVWRKQGVATKEELWKQLK